MKRIKRFYDKVSIGKNSSNTFSLLLDGKAVKTPLGEKMLFDSEGVACAIATEWELQKDYIVPNTMPMNTIMMTYMDVDSKVSRGDKLAQIGRFLQTDTIRFPDTLVGSDLHAQQLISWQPVLDFFDSRGIRITQSMNGFAIPPGAEDEINRIKSEILKEFTPLRLTVLETAAKYLKSGTVGIALLENAINPQAAFDAANVEEIVQRREWGEAEGDHDINDAETMLWLNGIRLLNNCLVS